MDARDNEKKEEANASNSLGWSSSVDVCIPLKIVSSTTLCEDYTLDFTN